MSAEKPTRLGYYRDPLTGDLWHLSEGGWSWVNGGRFRRVPDGLEWVGEPNPFRASREGDNHA